MVLAVPIDPIHFAKNFFADVYPHRSKNVENKFEIVSVLLCYTDCNAI